MQAIILVLLPGLAIPCWYKMTKNVKDDVNLNIHQFQSAIMLSEVDNIAKALHPLNASTTSLAKLISSSLNKTEQATFDTVITKMGPLLFQAFSTIPYISQISYIGLEGPFLSYYNDGRHIYAMYSNSTSCSNGSAPNVRKQHTWCKQLVDPNSGKLYGDATLVSMDNSSRTLLQVLNSTANGYASLGSGWNSGHDPLLLNTVGVSGNGVVSLGFSLESLTSLFSGVKFYGGSIYLAAKNGETLIRGSSEIQMVVNGTSVSFHLLKSSSDDRLSNEVGNVTFMPNNGSSRAFSLKFGKAKYTAYCSPVAIFGLQTVFALVLPHNDEVMNRIDQTIQIALILLILMIGVIVICMLSFIWLMFGAKTREIQLCVSLIKQMEATRQAERKSMNKTLAFARASHDIRNDLACITGLINKCYEEVAPGFDLEILQDMKHHVKDLNDLLNSVLNSSKIEAGKMQLQDEEFDLANFLESEVDLIHPLAAKKGVDVVLDPCDGSILNFSKVRGDKMKLKQILGNLLNNSVRFTSEGHISIRAWVQKPRRESKLINSYQNVSRKNFLSLFYKNDTEYNHLETMNTTMQDPNTMEFVFEVDDTGLGIPKENHTSVFENFLQVKETALGQGGIGLGLGIVQSLVHLMGGEIGIIDKQNRERGTCFRFNIFLTTLEIPLVQNDTKDETGDQYQGLTARSTSPRLSILRASSKTKGSIVVMLIGNEERRISTQRFMESLGIKVVVVSQWERLHSEMVKIKFKHSSPRETELGSSSDKSSQDATLSIMNDTEQSKLSLHNRSSTPKGVSGFVLLVIDASTGPIQYLCEVVAEFKKGLNGTCCKVVWVNKRIKNQVDHDDEILKKPFHGSRLYKVIRLLPEFRDAFSSQGDLDKDKKEHSLQHMETHKKRSPPAGSSSSKQLAIRRQPMEKHSEIEEIDDSISTNLPLSGIHFLVAEDNMVLQKLAKGQLSKLGAEVKLCANGEEALELVRLNLLNRDKHGIIPYDFILMDCEMPVMDGYEATRQIRNVEKNYGIHTPIIALTAHTSDGNAKRSEEAGMDAHLGKPLNMEHLLKIITGTHQQP